MALHLHGGKRRCGARKKASAMDGRRKPVRIVQNARVQENSAGKKRPFTKAGRKLFSSFAERRHKARDVCCKKTKKAFTGLSRFRAPGQRAKEYPPLPHGKRASHAEMPASRPASGAGSPRVPVHRSVPPSSPRPLHVEASNLFPSCTSARHLPTPVRMRIGILPAVRFCPMHPRAASSQIPCFAFQISKRFVWLLYFVYSITENPPAKCRIVSKQQQPGIFLWICAAEARRTVQGYASVTENARNKKTTLCV